MACFIRKLNAFVVFQNGMHCGIILKHIEAFLLSVSNSFGDVTEN
jgi:hypothetical protein